MQIERLLEDERKFLEKISLASDFESILNLYKTYSESPIYDNNLRIIKSIADNRFSDYIELKLDRTFHTDDEKTDLYLKSLFSNSHNTLFLYNKLLDDVSSSKLNKVKIRHEVILDSNAVTYLCAYVNYLDSDKCKAFKMDRKDPLICQRMENVKKFLIFAF